MKDARRKALLELLNGKPFHGDRAAFCVAAGITKGRLSQLLSQHEPFGDRAAFALEERLGLPAGTFDKVGNRPPEEQGVIVIPEYLTGGAMGDGLILRDQPGVIKSWRVSEEWVSKNARNYTATQNLCIVTGFGDSMRPMYNPGDPLLVDSGVRRVDYDGIYFFRVADEGFIKRLQRIPGEGLVAISENKAYRDWTIRPDMDFEVFGRVLKAWRGEDF